MASFTRSPARTPTPRTPGSSGDSCPSFLPRLLARLITFAPHKTRKAHRRPSFPRAVRPSPGPRPCRPCLTPACRPLTASCALRPVPVPVTTIDLVTGGVVRGHGLVLLRVCRRRVHRRYRRIPSPRTHGGCVMVAKRRVHPAAVRMRRHRPVVVTRHCGQRRSEAESRLSRGHRCECWRKVARAWSRRVRWPAMCAAADRSRRCQPLLVNLRSDTIRSDMVRGDIRRWRRREWRGIRTDGCRRQEMRCRQCRRGTGAVFANDLFEC